jgi:hypothetical protein
MTLPDSFGDLKSLHIFRLKLNSSGSLKNLRLVKNSNLTNRLTNFKVLILLIDEYLKISCPILHLLICSPLKDLQYEKINQHINKISPNQDIIRKGGEIKGWIQR